jgi:hypothetical protein
MTPHDADTRPPERVQRLDQLPQEIAPTRDLWPSIAEGISSGQARPTAGRLRLRRLRPSGWVPWAVAAGIPLLVVGAVSMWRTSDLGGIVARPDLQAATAGDPAFVRERETLAAALPSALAALPLQARIGATSSLSTVRIAQKRVLAALAKDNGNPALHEWLRDLQQQELRVMESIAGAGEQARML